MNTFRWVEMEKRQKERFFLRCFKSRITIFDSREEEETLWVKILDSDFSKIQKFWFLKVKNTRRTGYQEVKKKLHQQRFFLVSVMVGLVFLFFLSHVMLSVEVIHSNKEIRDLVTMELEERGVKENTWRMSYQEIEQIKEELLNAYPDKLEWLEIEIKGMKYIVRVEERKLESDDELKDACNLVAEKDGIIKEMVYSKGEALFKMNDAVKEGDILIRGTIDNGKENVGYTCATGEVYAEVWYKVNISIPFEYKNIIETDNKRWNIRLTNSSYDDFIFKSRLETYTEKRHHLFCFFGNEISFVTQVETIEETKVYSEEEALNKGLEEASLKIEATLEAKERILEKKVLKKEVNDSTMSIEVFVVVLENIAKTQEFVKGE